MIDLQGTEDLPYHQRHISGALLANLTISGRLTPVRLVSMSRMCPLRLLRATSTVHSKNLSTALLRYNFIRGFMRWCDVIFLLAWENFRPGAAVSFGTKVACVFGGHLLVTILLLAKAPLSMLLAAFILGIAAVTLLFLIVPRRRCQNPHGPIENRFPRAFTSPVDSPSGPAAPPPVGPLYADCTSDTPLRFCDLDAFFLPILKRKKGGYEGLILKPAAMADRYYERVETFTQPNPPVMKMLESAPQVSFILT
jgi:hypothetical protein